MTDFSAAESAFTAALRLNNLDERKAFLDRACGEGNTLRDAVERLLAAHADLGGFLEPVATTHDASATVTGAPGLGPGALLAGRYELIELIGEGGMGSVWSARQVNPVRRVVAVKLIKAGMDGRRVLFRFEAERQALAQMDHSNIARVFDGGEAPDGRPFFVMELVDGVPITEYCDRLKLTVRERLELFVPVCWAIQHAHQKGVIHRDIKPSNVLVEVHDEHPMPKVIDFGIAKATGPSLADTTLLTEFGDVVGTPEYMSPEQATLDNPDVDTRSDVYSLGVLLYELLTGSTPIARDPSRRGGLLELLRAVREDEPPRPSQKLVAAPGLPSLAEARGVETRRLANSLLGELDWIVMKALEKDRDRRFESVGQLSADIQRHLAGEPVLSAPPDLVYRLRKRFRRHRGPILAAGLTLLTLLVGIVGTSWGLLRADAERIKAVRASEEQLRARIAEATRADEAAQARREAARGQAELAMGHGQALCEQGEIAQGMWWMTRSLRLASDASDEHLARVARIGLADWSPLLGRRLARLKAPSPVLQLAFRPDGRGLVVLGEDGILRAWDSKSWRELSPTPAEPGSSIVGPVAFDPKEDGAFVAFDSAGRGSFGDQDRGIHGAPTVIHPARAPIRQAAYLGGSRRLITCGFDGALRWWNPETGLPADSQAGHVGRGVSAIAVSPDGSRLVTGGEDGDVIERDVMTGLPTGTALPHGSAVRQVVFLGDGRSIGVLTRDGRVRVWDRASRVSALPQEGTAIVSLAVGPRGDWFATGSEGGTVRLWDSATLRQVGPTMKYDVEVRSLCFRPDGRALAVALEDGSIPIWEPPSPDPIVPSKTIQGPVRVVGFSRNGMDLFAVGGGGLKRWCADRLDQPCRRCLPPHDGPQRPSEFQGESVGVTAASPDGRLIAATTAGGTGRPEGQRFLLIDAETGAVLRSWGGWTGSLAGVCFSPDSRSLMTWGAEPSTISLWDVGPRTEARPLARSLGVAVLNAAFSPDGKTLLLGCRDGKARLWDVARDVEVETEALPFHAYPITAVGFDPKTPRLVTGCHAGTVRLWDSGSGAMLRDVRGNAGEVTAVAFSPDGSTLLTASVDGAARFWDVATGRQLGPPLRHTDAVLCVAFRPDGRSIATGARDGTVCQWPVPAAPMEGDLDQIERAVEERTGLGSAVARMIQ